MKVINGRPVNKNFQTFLGSLEELKKINAFDLKHISNVAEKRVNKERL